MSIGYFFIPNIIMRLMESEVGTNLLASYLKITIEVRNEY